MAERQTLERRGMAAHQRSGGDVGADRGGERVIHTGNVLWTVDPATALPSGGLFLIHKYCHDLFTAQLPDASWMAVELLTFMIYLIYAGQIDLGT